MMKKQTATLPSTKPDHLYSSQQSQASLHMRPRNYQQQLTGLLTSLRATHKLRYYLLFRDLETVFSANVTLLSDLLGVVSTQQLWKLLGGHGKEQLRQQEQVGLLLRLLLELNSRKHAQADCGNIASFDHYRIAIEWLLPQIVAFETEIRLKLEEQLLQACEKEKKKRETDFKRYEKKMRQDFQLMETVRKENLSDRLQRQSQAKNAEVLEKIQHDMHKIRASSQLRDAKDAALLRKLAPYRWEKKRPYEDDTYRKELELTVDLDQNRRTKAIEQLKRVEKEKLRRAQETLVATQDMHAQTMRERLHIQLTNQGSALRGHEQQALRNLRHSVDIANHHRVNSLRKSLEAFSRHQDTLKIKQILQDHHHKVQFCNTIEEAVQPQATAKQLDDRYCTLHTDRTGSRIEHAVDRHQRRLKKRINVLLGEGESEQKSSGRKSLVELYDKSMNLVQQ